MKWCSWRFTCGDVSLFINNQMLRIFQRDWVQRTITSVTKTWTRAKNPPLLEAKPPNFRCLLREFGPIISYRNPCILCFPNENRTGKDQVREITSRMSWRASESRVELDLGVEKAARQSDSESGAAAAASGCLRTQLSKTEQNGSSMLAERLEKNAPRPRENPRERKLRKNSGSRWWLELWTLGRVSPEGTCKWSARLFCCRD